MCFSFPFGHSVADLHSVLVEMAVGLNGPISVRQKGNTIHLPIIIIIIITIWYMDKFMGAEVSQSCLYKTSPNNHLSNTVPVGDTG